jgi:hypothetical protein
MIEVPGPSILPADTNPDAAKGFPTTMPKENRPNVTCFTKRPAGLP